MLTTVPTLVLTGRWGTNALSHRTSLSGSTAPAIDHVPTTIVMEPALDVQVDAGRGLTEHTLSIGTN